MKRQAGIGVDANIFYCEQRRAGRPAAAFYAEQLACLVIFFDD
jgi:hypothetical protein